MTRRSRFDDAAWYAELADRDREDRPSVTAREGTVRRAAVAAPMNPPDDRFVPGAPPSPPRGQAVSMTATTKGARVRLVYCSDPYTRLAPGEEGTVSFVDSMGTVHVRWDSGSTLGLIPGEDRWEVAA